MTFAGSGTGSVFVSVLMISLQLRSIRNDSVDVPQHRGFPGVQIGHDERGPIGVVTRLDIPAIGVLAPDRGGSA